MRKRVVRAAILAVLALAAVSYGRQEKNILVAVEGTPIQVRTFASSVGQVIERAGIPLGPDDRVEPGLEAAVGDGARIEIFRAKELTLLIDGKPRRIVATGATIDEVLQEIELRGTMADKVRPSRATPVRDGMTIRYTRAVDLVVRHDDRADKVITNARTVGDVVKELKIKLGKRDRIEPAASTKPRRGMTIRVLRIGIRTESKTVTVDYTTVLKRDRYMEYGVRKVVQPGVEGRKRIVYRSKYVDGRRVSRTLVHTTWLRKPQQRIIAIGAGYPGCVCAKGSATGGASWYRQADGLSAAHRTLPFGTVVRVENLANGKWVNVVIRDRGPFVRGRVIDLSDEAFRRIGKLSTGVVNVRIRW